MINALPLTIVSGFTYEIGIYRRFSDDTFGITNILVSGCRISPNRVGVSASISVCGLLLFFRNSAVNRIRSIIIFDFCNSLGDTPISQRHHRSFPLINSAPPTYLLIKFAFSGFSLSNSSTSDFSKIKCPLSIGILPYAIGWTSQILLFLLSTRIDGASSRYGLILSA